MVKIEVDEQEIQALDIVFKEAKVPLEVGAIIINFRNKLLREFKKDFDSKQKEKAKELLDDGKQKNK